MANEIKLRPKQKIETMESMSILQEIARDILKVELVDNIWKRRLWRKIQARIDEVEDENLLKQIERKMQIFFFFFTIDLHNDNTNTKSLLN